MPLFSFLIPLRPKSESLNWKEDSALLRRTVGSLLRQTYPHFRVYVLYSDAPEGQPDDPRVEYVPFPYDFQTWDQLPNRADLLLRFKSEKKAERRWDKGRKLTYGAQLAKEAACDYIMALDSDDLLSKHFLMYLTSVSAGSTCAGWYMEKGYLYKEGSGYLLKVPRGMTALNGSTHVLRSDLVKVPEFTSLDWLDYSLFTDHGWVQERMQEYYHAKLEVVPTAMLVYVVHDSNMSQVKQKEYGFHLKALLKRLLRSKPLNRRLRDEFNLS